MRHSAMKTMHYFCWKDIYDDFLMVRSGIESEDIVNWYPCGYMKIKVRYKDGNVEIYDYTSKKSFCPNF